MWVYTNVTLEVVRALMSDHRWVLFQPNIDVRERPSNLVRSWEGGEGEGEERRTTRVYSARIINGAGNELIIINNI